MGEPTKEQSRIMGIDPSLFIPGLLAVSPEDARLPLQMLIVFGVAKVLGELAEWVRLPAIVGGLLSGILIGPSALGWIQYNELLHALAELGVMFLLFQVGLEVKASELLRVGRTAIVVAVLGVVFPFLLGWGILLGANHPAAESIFMGAAMVATSVGITAQVLADKGVLSHQTARIVLAAAVIDDVLGLLVLAVVSSMGESRGIDYVGLLTTTVVSVSFIVAVVKLGTPAVNLVLPKLRARLKAGESEFAVAAIFLFVMAVLATYSGVAAIIGAFLAGMALAETVSKRVHVLARGAGELLAPFFLASIGLQMSLAVFAKQDTLLLAVVIVAAAVLSKAVGCGAGAWRMGLKDASRIGIGMVPRGEVGMVVAQVGLTRGVIGQEAYGIAVFMAVMTTVIAPPLLNYVYRDLTGEMPAKAEATHAAH
jgi:Kef-type K+ transport system membrane component KefB